MHVVVSVCRVVGEDERYDEAMMRVTLTEGVFCASL